MIENFYKPHIPSTCSVLQCVAVCCSVLQCVEFVRLRIAMLHIPSVLRCVAVRCSVLRGVAVCCSVLQCVEFVGLKIATWTSARWPPLHA